MAAGGAGSSPQSYFGGVRSSFEFIAWSQVIACPVYVAMRPMMASIVLRAMARASLMGRPACMAANISRKQLISGLTVCRAALQITSPLFVVRDQGPSNELVCSRPLEPRTVRLTSL